VPGESDTFLLAQGFGRDAITDFEALPGPDHDVVEFAPSLFLNFAAVMADLVVTADANNALTLLNVQLASLSADDFARAAGPYSAAMPLAFGARTCRTAVTTRSCTSSVR
jgi:hypothetical protein